MKKEDSTEDKYIFIPDSPIVEGWYNLTLTQEQKLTIEKEGFIKIEGGTVQKVKGE